MKSFIITHNTDILWNSTEDANFNVDNEGRLSVISKWNLIGRLVKWVRDWNGDVTAKINEAIKETFDGIRESNAQNKFIYVRKRGNFWFFDSVRAYSSHYPAYYVAEKIQKSSQFSKANSIQEVASNILNEKKLYPDSEQRSQVILGVIYDDPKILYWDELDH